MEGRGEKKGEERKKTGKGGCRLGKEGNGRKEKEKEWRQETRKGSANGRRGELGDQRRGMQTVEGERREKYGEGKSKKGEKERRREKEREARRSENEDWRQEKVGC